MDDYRTRAEEVDKCCRGCIRVTSSTTAGITSFYYCMARKSFVAPLSICPWYFPKGERRTDDGSMPV